MTGKRFIAVQKQLGLSRLQMARLLGRSFTTILSWESGKVNVRAAKELEDLLRLPKAERVQFIKAKLFEEFGDKRQNVRGVGVLARALMEQHGFEREKAFVVAHYQLNIFPPTYGETSMNIAYVRAGTKTPKITKQQLKKMLEFYEERK